MNAIYLCTIAEPWIEVSKRLESEYNIKPSYFVHWISDQEVFIKSGFKDCYFQTVGDAWKGLGFPSDIERYIFDEEELRLIAHYELIALKMMDRLDPDGESFPFTIRQYFFRDILGYWFSVIENRKIDLVISPSIPHRVFDYALYVASKIKNIKIIMFQLTPFGSNSILINDINEMPELLKADLLNKSLSEMMQKKISKISGYYKDAIPSYMIQHDINDKKLVSIRKFISIFFRKFHKSYKLFTTNPDTYWVKKKFSPEETKFSWFDFYLMNYRRRLKVKSIKKKYNSIVINDLPKNFILVALHYQPEETSCPTGGVYADQILMIQLLDQYIPKDIQIIVKEHKSQFYTHQESASGRDELFYKRILQISNRISFISESYDPFELIDQAKAVITISGTIGWESAIRGTPVLVFGRAWYENMPRVFKVKTKEDLIMVWNKISDQKNKNLKNDIINFHIILENNFVKAKHYKSYLNNDDVDFDESVLNITRKIGNFLRLEHK